MPRARSRTPLSRERILRAALELADEGGIESLSMRRLGHALGFEAMSLYNHVAGKDDVLDGIVDLVLAETEPPPRTGEWSAAVRQSAISVHQALRRHPWAADLMMSADRIIPTRLRHMDSLLGRLREAGFSADTTYYAYHLLDAYVLGFSLWLKSHTYTPTDTAEIAERFDAIIPRSQYPHLREHGEQHLADGPHREVNAFELGLDMMLDGLEKLRAPAT